MTATLGIHRVIEQHAATHPDAVALLDGDRTLTYRELNRRGNVVARHLMDQEFRRGSQAVVRMDPSLELAVILLGVLKAGGAYTWLDEDADGSWPPGVSVVQDDGCAELRCRAMDITRAALEPAPPCPNLPLVTRAGDVACVLRGGRGLPAVLVPHATITALRGRPVPAVAPWAGEPGALDLWITLMAGGSAIVSAGAIASAAA